jgi:hypothetical protein
MTGVVLAAAGFPAVARANDAIIVKRVAGLDRAERSAVRAGADVELDAALSLPDTEVVVPAPGERDAALDALNANPDVVYAEPDLEVSPTSADPRFDNQWGLHNTGQTVWTVGTPDAERLPVGRYTLTLSTSGSSRSATFTVR